MKFFGSSCFEMKIAMNFQETQNSAKTNTKEMLP